MIRPTEVKLNQLIDMINLTLEQLHFVISNDNFLFPGNGTIHRSVVKNWLSAFCQTTSKLEKYMSSSMIPCGFLHFDNQSIKFLYHKFNGSFYFINDVKMDLCNTKMGNGVGHHVMTSTITSHITVNRTLTR